LIKIEGWARDGLTDEQIAQNIGIKRPTLYDWKNKYSDISDALKRGKEVVDRQVENALLKSATGYEYTEVTEELTENGMEIT
ncbi:helix-turn-helix domain-containing protein, partial [Enterococcus faecalis]|uniref:helix-turn-helix domain-containing protein n=1 Tax=Enterococcus faecalis TaxID=1351 RepID=UPI003D6B6E3C